MLETTAPIAVFRTGQGIVPHPKVGRAGAGAGGGRRVRSGVWGRGQVGGMGGLATAQDGGYHGGGGGIPWGGGVWIWVPYPLPFAPEPEC